MEKEELSSSGDDYVEITNWGIVKLKSADFIGKKVKVKAKNITENLTTNDNKEVVLNNVNNALNTYVTYHIHVLSDGEDINTIINKYKVNKELIDEYNSNLEWVMGEKVIIPELQDE